MGETYYDVLNVAPDASAEEIERAYRERVLETHPDRNDDPDAAAQFRAVSTAADVLTDETKRAKYDRLGHEAYCGDGSGTPDDGSPSDSDPHWPSAEWWDQYATTEGQSGGAGRSGPSHHARQRAKRERRSNAAGRRWPGEGTTATGATTDAETTADRSSSRSGATAQRGGAAGRSRSGFDWGDLSNGTASRRRPPGAPDGEDEEFSGFTVHQWDDDVELASPFRSLDPHTLVFACGLALLYPVFVYATITPHLPLLVNLVIGGCTFVLIGYLLTLPRIALATFGGWSVLATIALLIDGSVAAVSVVGLGLLAGFWIPFGYAVGVWVALRP